MNEATGAMRVLDLGRGKMSLECSAHLVFKSMK